MKKIIFIFFLLVILSAFLIITILSTTGIETKKFNNLISSKINQANNNINLKLTTIKFKINIKDTSLFFETINPEINFKDSNIPAKKVKVYVDFISLIKSNPKIKKVNFVLNEIDVALLKEISKNLKPSNFTSFVNNKIKQGKINSELNFFFNNDNLLDNFIVRGTVLNFKAEIIKNVNLEKTNFSFFADKTDVLVKNFFGETGPIKILDGDIKLKLSSEVSVNSDFKTYIKYTNEFKDYENLLKNFKYFKNITNLEGNFNNSIFINFDQTYKIKQYGYKNNGVIDKVDLDFKQNSENLFFKKKINKLSLINSEIMSNFDLKKNNISVSGKYSLNESSLLSFNLKNITDNDLQNLKLDADYDKLIELDFINYKKPKNSIANISINLDKQNNNTKINKINYKEGRNQINVEGLKFKKNKFVSLKKISVKTSKDNKINNQFSILYGKKIIIKGKLFDATNMPKFFNEKKGKNSFSTINKEMEIDFTNINAPLSRNLKNFKLLGKIEKGKFTNISSKGDFGENNFLDITLKKDQKSKKKYLEIYSDLPGPLLTEYSFFKGLSGGKLLYSSIIDGDSSNSKLIIENFKVINAPGMIKLLSLADLGGLADLAEGDGLSFDFLEINMEQNKDYLKFNEILALGPSISVLMDGYKDPLVTSIRGTLVPAKTLNRMIAKIPVFGNIVIPKEAGEGLFGISFKMKGPPGKIKTSINPIKTITPRFIQKIIDKKKF